VTAEESSALMAELPDAGEEPQLPAPPAGRGVARNTAIFSIATGISRVVGLVREIAAANVHLIVDLLHHDRISRDAPGVRLCFLVSLKQESRTARFSRIDTGGAVSP